MYLEEKETKTLRWKALLYKDSQTENLLLALHILFKDLDKHNDVRRAYSSQLLMALPPEPRMFFWFMAPVMVRLLHQPVALHHNKR